MIIPSFDETFQICDAIGEAAVEARLKTGGFANETAAHEWLLQRQKETDDKRIRREMKNTQWALVASWVLVGISLLTAIWQKDESRKQREVMQAQLEQQKKDSQAQREDSKALLAVQMSVEMDKQFDSPEMRSARKRLATQLLNKKRVREDRLLDFFETLAMYTSQGRIDKDTVYQSYSYWVERYFPALQSEIKKTRQQERDSTFYEGFEDLYKDMMANDKKDGLPVPDQKEVQRFLKEEAELLK